MIYLLRDHATPTQISEMLQEYEGMIKIVVDIRRYIRSGGGEMHANCEAVLLEDGSEQDDFGVQTGILLNNASHSNH